jgi:hypothetical protein
MRSFTPEQCCNTASGVGKRRIANILVVQLLYLERYGKGRNEIPNNLEARPLSEREPKPVSPLSWFIHVGLQAKEISQKPHSGNDLGVLLGKSSQNTARMPPVGRDKPF